MRINPKCGHARNVDRHLGVINMLKTPMLFVEGVFLAVGWLGAATVQAEQLPEVPAAKVIELTLPDSQEKPPVVSSIAIDPAEKTLAVVGDDHLVRILDLPNGSVISRRKSHTDWNKAAVFRPDGKLLATSGDDRWIRLWDPLTQERPLDLARQPEPVYCLSYSPDGQTLATAGFDDKIRMYESTKGKLLCEQPAPGSDIRALCFSPDGRQLAAAGRAGLVRVWTVSNCEQIFNVQASARRVCALAYSADGKILAIGGKDRIVRLLDTSTGKIMADLPERPGEVLSLCFCGSNFLASAGSGNVIHLWDVALRQERCRLIGHTGSVTTMVFEQGAATLVSGGFDTTIRLWNIKSLDQEQMTQR